MEIICKICENQLDPNQEPDENGHFFCPTCQRHRPVAAVVGPHPQMGAVQIRLPNGEMGVAVVVNSTWAQFSIPASADEMRSFAESLLQMCDQTASGLVIAGAHDDVFRAAAQ